MSAGPEGKSHAATWWVVLIAVPVLYVVTSAPVAALYDTGRLPYPPPWWFDEFYAPIAWAYTSPPFSDPLQAYLRWWWIVLSES